MAPRAMCGHGLLLTLGTGIGSALFVDGRVGPNTEFGPSGRGREQRSAPQGAPN